MIKQSKRRIPTLSDKGLKLIFLSFGLLLISSCGQTDKDGVNNDKRELSDFLFLEYGISYDEITAAVGPADEDVGFGLFLFVYKIEDGRRLTLQFGDLNSLGGVFIREADGSDHEIKLPIEIES